MIPWVATISLNVVLVAYVLDVLGLGATAYGLADMTYGVGAMVSGVFAALLVVQLGEWRAMTAVLIVLIGCYVALAASPAAVPTFYALLFVAGFCSSAFRVITSAYLFKVVPNEVMGRTSSTFLLASMVLQVAVTLGIGPLVNHTSARGGFALLAAIVAGGWCCSRAWRRRSGACRRARLRRRDLAGHRAHLPSRRFRVSIRAGKSGHTLEAETWLLQAARRGRCS